MSALFLGIHADAPRREILLAVQPNVGRESKAPPAFQANKPAAIVTLPRMSFQSPAPNPPWQKYDIIEVNDYTHLPSEKISFSEILLLLSP